MGFELEKIFLPSVGVDMVFNMTSLTPYSRPSIIYDINPAKLDITIAQPHIPLTRSTKYKQLHLTTIIRRKEQKIRVGLECTGVDIIERYPLANNSFVEAIRLRYKPVVLEINIRAAFRLPLGTRYIIKGKLIHNGLEYLTSRDFSIRDISLAGLGLAVPKKRKKRTNPLNELKKGNKLKVGIILIRMDKIEPEGKLGLSAEVIRINPNYSDTHTLIGLKIVGLKQEKEELLNQFIHAAQIDELKKRSRVDL